MGNKWQFAGTFWWFNHKELFSKTGEKGWNFIYPFFHGVEGYLGRLFPIEKSYCLFMDKFKDIDTYLFK
jgi:hypothetical protein